MYLKNIKAHGFKSFADKINIELNKGIIGIVGPNGSGKSNVVDAVRWVLGEQSVKSLRGDGNMTDVIFSGSKSRNAQNVASVTLIFDNQDHTLPLAYDEIALKRRVYKDGTNEYFINNERCRLKDINDLLLDSGIAKESFNIISQGKIEEIINSKPNDRRVIIEEAAGVLKYKKRKEEALRKLDKTHDNMSRVNDIINELEHQVEPLKEQAEKAIKYLEIKEKLSAMELSLITHDITTLNNKYQTSKNRIEVLNEELRNISVANTTNEAKITDFKQKINQLGVEIVKEQENLLNLTAKVEQINSQKQIILERQKYNVDNTKLHNSLIELKETELKLKNDITKIEQQLEYNKQELDKIEKENHQLETEIKTTKTKKQELEQTLTGKIRLEANLKAKIEGLKESIENNNAMPHAVKMILNNPKLNGIYNALGNIIETEEQYTTAINTALGASHTNIIVENEQSAKEAIQYLKNNNYGRATFLPLNIIKPKGIDPETEELLKHSGCYTTIASHLIKYAPKFHNIVRNQLGNIIVTDNLYSANIISKKINYRYRVVTLDGNLLHVGGSITGGTKVKTRSAISEKYELENNLLEQKNVIKSIQDLEDNINAIDHELKSQEDKLYLLNKERIEKEQIKKAYLDTKEEKEQTLRKTSMEITGTNNILNNTLSQEEETILQEYYEALNEKQTVVAKLEQLQKQQTEQKENLEDFEFSQKRENSIFNVKNKELKELEIETNRIDVKLDTLLNSLTEEYNMTYEKACTEYHLEEEEDIARNKVSILKKELKEIGDVNTMAPEEYQKVSERYDFLIKQQEDLTNAENMLLNIINELDDVMSKEFKETFETIEQHFTTTFKELFRGGNAELKLTDPNNLLETGIEIIASPPGKKLTSISLLSGGEKTFTAISLLFAILKTKTVSFCILDEVEAALDEVNVESFGNYLNTFHNKTQFILITHKKKTMEFADLLYGITMQESGVSKLVSVKLEEIK